MARLGTFDTQLEPQAWFDDNARAEGWFLGDLIPAVVVAVTKLWIKVSGVWREATTWINVSGTWKQATVFFKDSGTWK